MTQTTPQQTAPELRPLTDLDLRSPQLRQMLDEVNIQNNHLGCEMIAAGDMLALRHSSEEAFVVVVRPDGALLPIYALRGRTLRLAVEDPDRPGFGSAVLASAHGVLGRIGVQPSFSLPECTLESSTVHWDDERRAEIEAAFRESFRDVLAVLRPHQLRRMLSDFGTEVEGVIVTTDD